MVKKSQIIEEEVVESIAESEADQTGVTVRSGEPGALSTFTGIPIEGLQDVSVSLLPVPFVKLVQPTSKNVDLADGKTEASQGTFYFTDLQVAVPELNFVLLRAKQEIVEFDDKDGKKIKVPKIALLCRTMETQKLFIISLSRTGFSPFGKLIAKLKEAKMPASWHVEVKATTERKENDMGKFYVPSFNIVRNMSQDEIDELATAYGEFGAALDREDLKEQMQEQ